MPKPPATTDDPRDSSGEPHATRPHVGDDESSLVDLAIILAKHKRFVIGLPFAVAAFAAIFSLLLPNIYTATAKILQQYRSQGASIHH